MGREIRYRPRRIIEVAGIITGGGLSCESRRPVIIHQMMLSLILGQKDSLKPNTKSGILFES